ncbi:MAG: HK97 family phage prohead protease [Mesorhizobium sp.]|uniref:HK97 family phage prohead protease n=1 Tax=Mesorhizobium sp. TaxID=1871066 RepID=UPI000FE99382|nr:HK97 family phage prohead protease [Mesorhizobium sp.]RWA76669.1 MAG: HK97 family phage prohead protease [Mesorhizobium sp.]RWC05071.1 MAG: HK97 family phage prohead protease [Mesorhizobium sp.]RWC90046.1 MAG: HK97 family phage prohead protease [Mesorhizobium sp.]
MERRAGIELRAVGRKLAGYAAVFGQDTRIHDFTETILPGAFSDSLRQGRDILALADHDQRAVLARTRSGTLRLSEDSRGLAFELDVPDTSAGRDILALAERGDIGGASFGFTIGKDGERWQGDRRQLSNIILHEISVVQSWPAYDGTEVHARHRPTREAPDAGLKRVLARWRA